MLASSGPGLGIRESRRIKGGYTLTKEDYLNRADFPDAIAYYSYPIDIHAALPEKAERMKNFIRLPSIRMANTTGFHTVV